MSDTTDLRERLRTRLEQVRVHLRDLELDATLIRGRTEETREEEAALLDMLDDSPRRRPGRPRKAIAGLTVLNEPECDEPQTEEVA
jgi:hypothetical protein